MGKARSSARLGREPRERPAAELARLRGARQAPTISDVAAAAGVSPMTVSRVLNGGSCSDKARRAVERAVRELNYAPNAAAQALAAARKRPRRSEVAMPRVWQSYAELMLQLMRPRG